MYRLNKRERELKARHPTQPWLWRESWSQKRITYRPLRDGLGLLAFAIAWNAIGSVFSILALRDIDSIFRWLFLFFPLVGLLLLWGALRSIAQALRDGPSTLHLSTVPQNLGKRFSARLECVRIPERGPIRTAMVCVLRQRGDKRIEEHVLWRDEAEVPRSSVNRTPRFVSIPIEFQLPDNLRETETINEGEEIAWRVQVSIGDKDAPDFTTGYEIPVFGGRNAFLEEQDRLATSAARD